MSKKQSANQHDRLLSFGQAHFLLDSAVKFVTISLRVVKPSNAKAGSMASKANLVKEFNEKNNRK